MQPNPLSNLSLQQLKQAIAIRGEIEDLQKELDRIVGDQPSTPKPKASRKRRKLSAAARAKISAAASARWANFRAKKGNK